MTAEQAKAIIDAKSSNFSGNGAMEYYSGNGSFEYYSGASNPTLEFNGDAGSSLINLEGAEPFVLQVVNANASTRSFYFSQGLLYTRGSESQGQLKTGNFQGIEDTGTVASLTASTSNSISIEQFISYSQLYPTYVPLIQLTSTSATAQLGVTMQRYRQGMIKNEAPTTIPMRKYARGDQYNLQFQDVVDPLYLSKQDIIIVSVAGSSTLTLNIYPLASKNSRASLFDDVKTARKLVQSNPQLAAAWDQAIKAKNA